MPYRIQCHAENEEAQERSRQTVTVLDHCWEVERRDELAFAKRPVITAPHAGFGDPDNSSEDDQRVSQRSGDEGEQGKPKRDPSSGTRGLLFMYDHS